MKQGTFQGGNTALLIEREKMKTETSKQIELLSAVSTLDLFTNQSLEYKKFAKAYEEELTMVCFVRDGFTTLTENGLKMVNEVWKRLLRDHLSLEDTGSEDMNSFIVAIHERGGLRGNRN